jgi:hypothetical protein
MGAIRTIAKSERTPRSPMRGTPVLVRLQPEQLKAIDAWRRDQEHPPSRPEALRRLATDQFSKRSK